MFVYGIADINERRFKKKTDGMQFVKIVSLSFFNFKTFPALNPLIYPPWRIVSNYSKWVNRLHMTMNNVNVGGENKKGG